MRTGCLVLGLLAILEAAAQGESPAPLQEIVVYGRAIENLGVSRSASEGSVARSDIELPPLLRVGQLVEAAPGAVATQHSGSGKANQFFLRGFNLDHGTDFSASIEGVPLNMPTHGHGQGYLDLNFLIPELIEITSYRKGPYFASIGNFSSAGSVDFQTYDRLDESAIATTLGEHAYYRAMAAGSVEVADGSLLLAVDAVRNDGPWQREEGLTQHKVYAGYFEELANGAVKLTYQGYDSDWNSTDQIPRRAVVAGTISPTGFIDPDLGGHTRRQALSGRLSLSTWDVSAYVVDYDFTLFSNFTYMLDNPTAGDEFEQRDSRTTYGLSLGQNSKVLDDRRINSWRWGATLRRDEIDELGLFSTISRVRTDAIRQDAVSETAVGLFGELETQVLDRLRTIVGLRADYLDWDVNAFRLENSGTGDDILLSPKFSLAYRIGGKMEAYANWGKGFHSNDVRGATIAIDPASGEPINAVEAFARSRGGELGLRFENGSEFNATVTAFWLELDSELIFVGDAGTTEPNEASTRVGLELAAFWWPTDWLALDASYTRTDAEIDSPIGRKIPGAIESTMTLGANAVLRNGFSASTQLRYLGTAPLTEDGLIRSDNSLLANAGVAWRRDKLEFRLDLFNMLDSDDSDIAYYYRSRLAGEPASGVEDIHFHPLQPRMSRLTVTYFLQ